jgi:RNA polymerase sigma-70 factor (ECF subfamily)
MDVKRGVGLAIPISQALAPPAAVPEAGWETTLIRSCQSGDPDAFRVLVERYQGKVFSIAHKLVRRRADVEDIAQEVFTKVYFSIGSFDFRSALLTWIYRITINECYDHLRKHRSDRTVCVSEMTEAEAHQVEMASSVSSPPDRHAEMAEMVSRLLGRLSSQERLLLLMKEVEGYSIQDLSRMFAWNENTLKVKLFRARRRLAQLARKRLPRPK